jgi:hypothetical protein
MSDLAAFEPVWDGMAASHRALATTITALPAAGLIDPPSAGPEVTPEQVASAAARARRRFRRSRVADALRGRPAPVIPKCAHTSVVEVESAGEVVAGLCRQCDTQLSAAWFTCPHADAATLHTDSKTITTPQFGYSIRLALRHCPACEATWWSPRTYADWVSWL